MSLAASDPARRILHNSVVLAVAKLLERATGFIVALLVAAELGASGLGVYAAAWTLYGLMAIAGEAGTTNYLVREVSRAPKRTASYTVHLSVVAVAFATVLLLAGEVVVRLVYSGELQTAMSVILVAVLPKVLNSIQEAVFVAHGRVAFETLTRLGASIVYVGLAAWLLGGGSDVPTLLRAFVAVEWVVAAVYFMLINRFIARLAPRFRWLLAVRLVREMKAYIASSAIGALFSRPEVLILSLLASNREVGLYSAALRVGELPLLVPEVFMTNVFPLLSQAYGRDERRFAAWQSTAVRAMAAFALPIAACFLVSGDGIIRLLYGSGFATSGQVLQLLSVNVVAFSLFSIFWRSLVARGGQTTNVAVQGAMVGVRLVAGALLIAPFAAIGAAVTSGVTGTLHLLLLTRAVRRTGTPTGILRAAWRFAVAALALGLTVWLLEGWLPLEASVPIGVVAYCLAALAVRAVTPQDRELLRGALRPPASPSPPPAAAGARAAT